MRILVLLFVTLTFVAPGADARAGTQGAGTTRAQAKPPKTSPKKRLPAFRSERRKAGQ